MTWAVYHARNRGERFAYVTRNSWDGTIHPVIFHNPDTRNMGRDLDDEDEDPPIGRQPYIDPRRRGAVYTFGALMIAVDRHGFFLAVGVHHEGCGIVVSKRRGVLRLLALPALPRRDRPSRVSVATTAPRQLRAIARLPARRGGRRRGSAA